MLVVHDREYCLFPNCKSLGKAHGKGRNCSKHCRKHLADRKCQYCKDPIRKGGKKWCLKCFIWWRQYFTNSSAKGKRRKHEWYLKNKEKYARSNDNSKN